MEAERGCGWPGCPISAALAADSAPEVGVPHGLTFLLSCPLLFTPGAPLAFFFFPPQNQLLFAWELLFSDLPNFPDSGPVEPAASVLPGRVSAS